MYEAFPLTGEGGTAAGGDGWGWKPKGYAALRIKTSL